MSEQQRLPPPPAQVLNRNAPSEKPQDSTLQSILSCGHAYSCFSITLKSGELPHHRRRLSTTLHRSEIWHGLPASASVVSESFRAAGVFDPSRVEDLRS
jgi:hypothetical protein